MEGGEVVRILFLNWSERRIMGFLGFYFFIVVFSERVFEWCFFLGTFVLWGR